MLASEVVRVPRMCNLINPLLQDGKDNFPALKRGFRLLVPVRCYCVPSVELNQTQTPTHTHTHTHRDSVTYTYTETQTQTHRHTDKT